MNRLFDMDNSFFRFMGKIADLICLNFLFMLGCIPIVTIGTSISATYYVALKMVRGQDPYIVKNYFKAYKENLLQTVCVDIIMAVITFVLYLDYYLIYNPNTSLGTGTLIMTIAITVIYVVISLYMFPYIAQFKNTIPKIIQNCLFMSIRHFGQTITLFIISTIPFWAIVVLGFENFTIFLFILLMFGFSGMMFVNAIVFVKVFDNYIPKNDENVASAESIFVDEMHTAVENAIETAEEESGDSSDETAEKESGDSSDETAEEESKNNKDKADKV